METLKNQSLLGFLFLSFLLISSSLFGIGGNSVILSPTMNDTTAWKLEMVESAESSVEISVGYGAGKPLLDLLQILEKKLESNPIFSVKMLLTSWPHNQKEEFELLERLETNYGDRFDSIISNMVPTMQGSDLPLTTEIHVKMLIVDGKYFVVGGSNLFDETLIELSSGFFLTDSLFPRIFQDADIIGRGPVVTELRRSFYLLFDIYRENVSLENKKGPYIPDHHSLQSPNDIQANFAKFEESDKIIHNVEIKSILSGPRVNYGAIGKRLNEVVISAVDSIDIGHLYFFPYEELYASMIDASNRGVDFSLITNGFQSNSPQPGGLFALESRHHLFPIMAGKTFKWYEGFSAAKTPIVNANIFEYNSASEAIYHKKVMVIDKKTVFIGSYNLGKKSQFSDFEIELEITDSRVAADVLNMLKEDRSHGVKVDPVDALNWYYNPGYIIGTFVEDSAFNGFFF